MLTPEQVISAIQSKDKNFRSRPGQSELIRLAYDTLLKADFSGEKKQDGSSILVADAPTGVGKSLGYLIPSICVREQRGMQVVLSTATISLQEQLLADIQILEKALGKKISVAIAKGRSRFLCPLKLDEVTTPVTMDMFGEISKEKSHTDEQKSEAQVLAENFAMGKWTGDKDELSYQPDEKIWSSISTDSHGCIGKHCRHVSNCPYMKAKARFTKADIVIANHALVLADMKIGFSILPKPVSSVYIFDEAHNLPKMAVGSMATSHPVVFAPKWIERVPRTVERLVRVGGISSVDVDSVKRNVNELISVIRILEEYVFELPEFSNIEKNARVLPSITLEGELPDIFHGVGNLIYEKSSALALDMNKVKEACAELVKESQEVAKAVGELGTYTGRMSEIEEVWGMILAETRPNQAPIAKWLELKQYGREYEVTVNASPVSAAEKLKGLFWNKVGGAILVSATMAVVGGFRSILKRTGLSKYEMVTAVKLESPFDYHNNGTLILCTSSVDPRSHVQHTDEVARVIPTIVDCESGEGTLCLFASRRQMEEVFEKLPHSLQSIILMQGKFVRGEIIKRHKERVDKGKPSVIFGLQTFGEGVDLKNRYCTHVVIAKIPFDPPTTPVEKVTANWLKSLGADPFMTLVVPEASVKLIQNVGRLLRTEADQGKITILDRRLATTRYGALILSALPPFKVEKVRIS